jgi:hypothetical protein
MANVTINLNIPHTRNKITINVNVNTQELPNSVKNKMKNTSNLRDKLSGLEITKPIESSDNKPELPSNIRNNVHITKNIKSLFKQHHTDKPEQTGYTNHLPENGWKFKMENRISERPKNDQTFDKKVMFDDEQSKNIQPNDTLLVPTLDIGLPEYSSNIKSTFPDIVKEVASQPCLSLEEQVHNISYDIPYISTVSIRDTRDPNKSIMSSMDENNDYMENLINITNTSIDITNKDKLPTLEHNLNKYTMEEVSLYDTDNKIKQDFDFKMKNVIASDLEQDPEINVTKYTDLSYDPKIKEYTKRKYPTTDVTVTKKLNILDNKTNFKYISRRFPKMSTYYYDMVLLHKPYHKPIINLPVNICKNVNNMDILQKSIKLYAYINETVSKSVFFNKLNNLKTLINTKPDISQTFTHEAKLTQSLIDIRQSYVDFITKSKTNMTNTIKHLYMLKLYKTKIITDTTVFGDAQQLADEIGLHKDNYMETYEKLRNIVRESFVKLRNSDSNSTDSDYVDINNEDVNIKNKYLDTHIGKYHTGITIDYVNLLYQFDDDQNTFTKASSIQNSELLLTYIENFNKIMFPTEFNDDNIETYITSRYNQLFKIKLIMVYSVVDL